MLPVSKAVAEAAWASLLDDKIVRTTRRQRYLVDGTIIRRVFSKLGKTVKASGAKYLIAQCPFHGDKSESLYVKLDGTMLRCFSKACEANSETMDWIAFAKKLGITDGLIGADDETARSEISHGLNLIAEMLGGNADAAESFIADAKVRLPGKVSWSTVQKPWRGLPGAYLASRGAVLWNDVGIRKSDNERIHLDRLVLPIRDEPDGTDLGWVAEAFEMKYRDGPEKVSPKCRNMPGLSNGLWFGLDTAIAKRVKTVVLVEGPFDQARFDHYGIPTVALLGTGTVPSHRKVVTTSSSGIVIRRRRLVEAGFIRVLSCMDGDAAGLACAEDLRAFFGEWLEFGEYKLPAGDDPGKCDEKHMAKIRRLCV